MKTILVFGVTATAGLLIGVLRSQELPRERVLEIRARQYGYSPPTIKVNKGDTVRIRLISEDVVHGFFLEGYDLDAKIYPGRSKVELSRPSKPGAEPEWVEDIVLVAHSTGKFRYRCSRTCGYLHPFMLGEMVVEPNSLFWVASAMAAALGTGVLVTLARRHTP